MLLQVPRALYNCMIQYCQAALPREACGLLTGRDGMVQRAFAVRNAHPQPREAYRVDPVDEHAVLQAARQAGEELVAVFHSHPAAIAYPSRSDLDLARPGAFYLIVSLAQDPPDVRAYTVEAGKPRSVPFRKLEAPPGEWVDLREA